MWLLTSGATFTTVKTSAVPSKLRQPQGIYLKRGNVHSIRRESQVVRVLSGCAWITFDGQDVFLKRGEKTCLPPGEDTALISAMGNSPLVFSIE